MIDCELDIINMGLEHPERFIVTTTPKHPCFGMHLASKPNNLGIIGIAEIVIALWLSSEIVGDDGKPVPLKRIANAFEFIFSIRFGDIYDKQDAIFNRKPFNRTKALDFLRNLLIRKDKTGK